jgi:iron(III) transport system permease protein
MVALGVAAGGRATAAAVTLFEFPGRRVFEWALLLPLAMPAYVVAYAYTDFLQFSGPLQTWLRSAFGLEGRVFPEVRSVGGAAWVFTFALYPYVYLLARTALGRACGAPDGGRAAAGRAAAPAHPEVALPLARPAVAAGVALALMETLADFGVSSYFGIQTFTAGIYKAWLSMDNRIAAAQLATMLLVVVAAAAGWSTGRKSACVLPPGAARARLGRGAAGAPAGRARWLAWLVCGLPVLLGFVLPVLFMLRPLAADWSVLPWDRLCEWAFNSVRLGGITAALAVGWRCCWLFSRAPRKPDAADARRGAAGRPGLCRAGRGDRGGAAAAGGLAAGGRAADQRGLLVTATVLGIVWAYLVRFCAVALQSVQSGYARIPRQL